MKNDPRMGKFLIVYHDVKETVWSINAEEAAKLLCICITKEVSIPMRKPTNQERYLLNRQLLK